MSQEIWYKPQFENLQNLLQQKKGGFVSKLPLAPIFNNNYFSKCSCIRENLTHSLAPTVFLSPRNKLIFINFHGPPLYIYYIFTKLHLTMRILLLKNMLKFGGGSLGQRWKTLRNVRM